MFQLSFSILDKFSFGLWAKSKRVEKSKRSGDTSFTLRVENYIVMTWTKFMVKKRWGWSLQRRNRARALKIILLPGGGGGTGSVSSTAVPSISTGSMVDILRVVLVETGEEGEKALADARAQRMAIERNIVVFSIRVSYDSRMHKINGEWWGIFSRHHNDTAVIWVTVLPYYSFIYHCWLYRKTTGSVLAYTHTWKKLENPYWSYYPKKFPPPLYTFSSSSRVGT